MSPFCLTARCALPFKIRSASKVKRRVFLGSSGSLPMRLQLKTPFIFAHVINGINPLEFITRTIKTRMLV